jgi:muramidase (phage lysozyme)
VAVRRTNRFNPDVDQSLLSALEAVGGNYAPYDVELFSGYRPNPSLKGSFHGKHGAIDVNLIDRKSGRALPNIRDAASAPAYQQYANSVYQWALANNPQLAAKLRWGGYFAGGAQPMDLMHFDLGGGQGGLGMAGGSWQGGFNPEMADAWGLKPGGGIGGGVGPPMSAMPDYRAAFLDAIAQGESPGYDVLYGGSKFSDYSRHPGQSMPIFDPNHPGQVVGHSTAAGRYQFLAPTWQGLQQKYGYKDFSPENQDAAAWQLAQDDFKARTGGSLEEALKSGDAGRINAAAQALKGTWESLGKLGNRTFADIYNNALGKHPGTTPAADEPAVPGYSTGGQPAPAAAPKKQGWGDMLKAFGEGMSDINFSGGKFVGGGNPITEAARVDAPEVAPVAALGADRRQQLAEVMARLNSGRLW